MRYLLLTLFCLALASCGDAAIKTYSYTPPESLGGRMCTNQCRLSDDYCAEQCDTTHRNCVTTVQKQALKDYDKYAREQYAAGQPIEFKLRDFERMTPCNDAHEGCYNSCEKTYGTCYVTCGGKVDVTSACSPLCF